MGTGSKGLMRWLANRRGDLTMDPQTVSMDHGMNDAFEALPAWHHVTHGKRFGFSRAFGNHQGHTALPLAPRARNAARGNRPRTTPVISTIDPLPQ